MTEYDADVRVLLDKLQIHEALMRYCRGVDRGDAELVLSAFHDDASADYGRGPGSPSLIAEGITKMTAQGAMHFIGNELVEVDGDTAFSECYFISYATVTQDDQPATRSRGGRYLDRFERRGGEWRIAYRVLVDEWSRMDPIPGPVAPRTGHVGLRSKEDLVYHMRTLGLV
jgi:hypothetical protein